MPHAGNNLVSLVPLANGTRVPYMIVAPLGAGGMGEVYRALDSTLGREVGQAPGFHGTRRGRTADLWTMPLDLGNPDHPKPGATELYLRTPFDEFSPAFSPDGYSIAWALDGKRS